MVKTNSSPVQQPSVAKRLVTILSFIDQLVLLPLITYGVAVLLQYNNTENGWVIMIYLAPLFVIETVALIIRLTVLLAMKKSKPPKNTVILQRGLIISGVLFGILLILTMLAPTLASTALTDTWKQNELFQVHDSVTTYANFEGKVLPESLDSLGFVPSISKAIDYVPNSKAPQIIPAEDSDYGQEQTLYFYQLCTTFNSANNYPIQPETVNGIAYDMAGYPITEDGYQVYPDFESHPSGRYCFKIKTL